jgi:hypothetical protein
MIPSSFHTFPALSIFFLIDCLFLRHFQGVFNPATWNPPAPAGENSARHIVFPNVIVKKNVVMMGLLNNPMFWDCSKMFRCKAHNHGYEPQSKLWKQIPLQAAWYKTPRPCQLRWRDCFQ